MRRRRSLSKMVFAVVLPSLAVVVSACLVPPKSSVETDGGDGPDPSWVRIHHGLAQVFTTNINSSDPNCEKDLDCIWVPSYTTLVPPASKPTPTVSDALPTIPSASNGNIWGPSARLVTVGSGESGYLMVFSEGMRPQNGNPAHADCIGAATSTNGVNFTALNTWTFCDPNSSIGYLDPDIFVDPRTGNVWLYYSRQAGPNGTNGDGSEIDAVQINADAIYNGTVSCGFPDPDCGIVGEVGTTWSAYELFDYSQVIGYNTDPGGSAFVEGPSMTSDDYNGYDMTVSVGTYSSNATYETVEVPCLKVDGKCVPAKGREIMAGDGGASALVDTPPSSNWLIWHSWNSAGTARQDFAGATSEVKKPPSNATPQSDTLPIRFAAPDDFTTPYILVPRVRLSGEGNFLISSSGVTMVPATDTTAPSPTPENR
jgi:hypothetical protein